jgi:hypothetical protein
VTLQALKFPPGVVRTGTDGMSRGRWWNANLIRWRSGALVPVGGWDRLTTTPLSSPARKLLTWRSNLDVRYVAIGTDSKLELLDGDTFYDKTPPGFVPFPAISQTVRGGYGTGDYDEGTYDTPRESTVFGPGGNPYAKGAIWTLGTFGEDVMAVASSDGRLLHMSPNSTTTASFDAQALPIADAPLNNRGVIVTEERHVMLFGANGNPRRVAWCSREDFNDWDFADPNNTAGFIDLDCDGTLVNACRVRGGVLFWSENEAWIARYKGLPAIYGFEKVGEACGLIGGNAFAGAGGGVIWVGYSTFWSYDNGTVAPVQCDVADYFFRRIDVKVVSDRIAGGANGRFTEAWFFFPEIGQGENNAYVAFNYPEKWWTIGKLDRSAIQPAGVWPYPLMGGLDGHLYQHERGWTAAGVTRANTVFIESGAQQFPPGGDKCLNVLGAQLDSGTSYDSVELRAFTREAHDDPVEYEEGPFQPYSDGLVECRFSGRDIRLRIEQVQDQQWSVGEMRFDVVPGRGR